MGALSKDYAKIAKALNDLLVGNPTGVIVEGKTNKNSSVPKICGPKICAFDTLKEILSYPSVLVYVDLKKNPFCIQLYQWKG